MPPAPSSSRCSGLRCPTAGTVGRGGGQTLEPPRLIIDVEQFTGDEAVQAAIDDGAVPSDWTAVENRFHIRNVDPRWCVIEVDPAASVRLTTYPYGDIDEPRVATLERFGELFASSRLLRCSYWITMEVASSPRSRSSSSRSDRENRRPDDVRHGCSVGAVLGSNPCTGTANADLDDDGLVSVADAVNRHIGAAWHCSA